MAEEKSQQTKVGTDEKSSTANVQAAQGAPNSSSTSTSPAAQVAQAEQELISLEDLDKIIDQNDPDFNNNLSQVTAIKEIHGQNIELLDLDQILAEEKSQTFKARWHRLQRRIGLFVVSMIVFVRNIFLMGFKEALPLILKQIKSAFAYAGGILAKKSQNFKYLSLQKKLAAVAIGLLSVFVLLFTYRSLTVGVIPKNTQLFVNSIEELAKDVYVYQKEDAQEDFYDSPRVKQNIMALRKAVVNLKRSAGSGPNPMAFFEFFIEGNSTDVMIELKDREYEIIDVVQRIIEDMTYSELDSVDGKQGLLEKVRKELNSLLTKGKVKRVYIKQAIIKP